MLHGRKSRQYLIVSHIADNAAAACHHIVIADSNMPYRSRLPAKGIVITNGHAARDSHQRNEQVVLTDHIIVAQMHQIIHLGPVADDGTAHRSPVNAGIAADLHIVAQDHVPGLLDLIMFSVIRNKAKAIAADHTSRLEDIPIADDAVFPYDSLGINDAVAADLYVPPDIGMGIDHRIIPDLRPCFHNGKRLDSHILPDDGVLCHIRQRTDDALHFLLGTE